VAHLFFELIDMLMGEDEAIPVLSIFRDHAAETGDVLAHLPRCLEQFEDFCIVTQSVRQGIPVNVEVRDASGATLTRPV
jgi:hypothetical protein